MGRGLHTVPVRRCAPLPSLVRLLLHPTGVGSPGGRDPRGRRRLGALGRAVCRSSRIPPPASRSLLGEGGHPLGYEGAEGRSCGSQAGGGAGGGGAHPRAPALLGVSLPSVISGLPPLGYTRAVGVAWRPRASGAVRSAANGSVRRGGGGGGRNPPALVHAPVFPWPASDRAPRFAPSWAPPIRHRPAAGRACGRLPRPWCPRTRGQRPLRGEVPGRRCFSQLRPLLGLSGRRGGSGGGPLVPSRRLLTAEGGAAWRSQPRGPAIGWGVAPFPHPPLPRAGPSTVPLMCPRNQRQLCRPLNGPVFYPLSMDPSTLCPCVIWSTCY